MNVPDLETAWREAESLAPPGHCVYGVMKHSLDGPWIAIVTHEDSTPWGDQMPDGNDPPDRLMWEGSGATPAAALRDVAARLREYLAEDRPS